MRADSGDPKAGDATVAVGYICQSVGLLGGRLFVAVPVSGGHLAVCRPDCEPDNLGGAWFFHAQSAAVAWLHDGPRVLSGLQVEAEEETTVLFGTSGQCDRSLVNALTLPGLATGAARSKTLVCCWKHTASSWRRMEQVLIAGC